MKGGQKIGEGTYGCVYKPALRCRGSDIRPENTVSKLMVASEARKEISEMKRIHEIDPEYHFHLRGPQHCPPNELDPEIDGYLGDCYAVEDEFFADLSILHLEDGGQDVRKFANTIAHTRRTSDSETQANHYIKLFSNMKNLFEGLSIMRSNKYGHFDIKDQNVVVKDHVYKFIDFGLASDFRNAPYNVPFQSTYFAWPLEAFLIRANTYDKAEELLLKVRSKFSEYAYITRHFNTSNGLNSPIHSMIGQSSMQPALLNYIDNVGMDAYRREIIAGVDTYSLGIMLIMLWHKILGTKFIWTETSKDYYMPGSKHYEALGKIRTLIYKMTHPLAFKRIHIDDAIIEHKNIMDLIERTKFAERVTSEMKPGEEYTYWGIDLDDELYKGGKKRKTTRKRNKKKNKRTRRKKSKKTTRKHKHK